MVSGDEEVPHHVHGTRIDQRVLPKCNNGGCLNVGWCPHLDFCAVLLGLVSHDPLEHVGREDSFLGTVGTALHAEHELLHLRQGAVNLTDSEPKRDMKRTADQYDRTAHLNVAIYTLLI